MVVKIKSTSKFIVVQKPVAAFFAFLTYKLHTRYIFRDETWPKSVTLNYDIGIMPHLLKDGNGCRKLCEKVYAINYAEETILNYWDMR